MKHKNCKLIVWKIQSLILMKKNVMKEKANELVRLHEAKLEKIENSVIFRTNPNSCPDKWSQRYFSDYFNVFE